MLPRIERFERPFVVTTAVYVIFDRSSYGPDGTIWGGEILVANADSFDRAGMLFPVRLPGGEAAVRQPWRMACAWLSVTGDGGTPVIPSALCGEVSQADWEAVAELARSGVASPITTSAARLFDAIAAICGICAWDSREGEAATELERVVRREEPGAYPLELIDGGEGGALILDPRCTVLALVDDLVEGAAIEDVAGRFHNTLAAATAAACANVAERHGLQQVVLFGSVFQNRLLLERTTERLCGIGLNVSDGQAVAATAR